MPEKTPGDRGWRLIDALIAKLAAEGSRCTRPLERTTWLRGSGRPPHLFLERDNQPLHFDRRACMLGSCRSAKGRSVRY